MPSNAELLLRVVVTMLLSGAIGLERELREKAAGFRTHISVALGSCLFAFVSAYSFEQFGSVGREASSYQVDVTRIASAVVTGIGFLGGGAILKHGATVRGLTTAASLWVTAAVGLAVGLGGYYIATVITVALLVALVGLKPLAVWVEARYAHREGETVIVTLEPGADAAAVVAAIHQLRHLEVASLTVRQTEERCYIEAHLRAGVGHEVEALVAPLLDRQDVAQVEVA